jgi:cytochrome c-type biogenesis protein CcmE
MIFVVLILLGVSAAAAFLLTALKGNVQYNILPTDVFAGKAPVDRTFRLGGMVEEGRVKRSRQHADSVRYHYYARSDRALAFCRRREDKASWWRRDNCRSASGQRL